jgi:uncharacterized membrane protein
MKTVHTNQRWCAALMYVVVGLLWYALDKGFYKNSFLDFHRKQAIIFLLSLLLVQVAATMFAIIPFIWPLLAVLVLYIGISGVLVALQGREKDLPVIGRFVQYLEL